jgi:hypothetical protein
LAINIPLITEPTTYYKVEFALGAIIYNLNFSDILIHIWFGNVSAFIILNEIGQSSRYYFF